MKKLTILIAIISSVFMVSTAQNPMKEEMDKFLAAMPEGMQTKQAKAIYAAIDGDFTQLNAVRSGRKPAINLPQGVDTLRVREDMLLFFPADMQPTDNLPLLVYLHGGGWTFGSINSCSRYCGAVATKGIMVVAIDYPLSPDHTNEYVMQNLSTGIDFILNNAASWGADPKRVSIGGDSCGGSLALGMALMKPGKICSLVNFYPVTDMRTEATEGCPFGTGYGNDAVLMEAFRDSYLGRKRTKEKDPYLSPIFASDEQLAALPPTLIVAAEYDILTPQGKIFADRIANLGVLTTYVKLPGTTHLFITVPGQTAAFNRAVQITAQYLK